MTMAIFRDKHERIDHKELDVHTAHVIQREPTWDDLRFPAQGIDPVGSASPPDVSTDDGSLLFANTTDEVITIIAQMPHAWHEATAIIPHVHWSKTTSAAGTVAWKCEYKRANPGDTFGAFTELATTTTP